MENKLLKILEEVSNGFKTPIIAQEEIISLFKEDSSLPTWLSKENSEFAKMLYKESKVNGVKYLRDLARPHLDNPLYFASEFLKNNI